MHRFFLGLTLVFSLSTAIQPAAAVSLVGHSAHKNFDIRVEQNQAPVTPAKNREAAVEELERQLAGC